MRENTAHRVVSPHKLAEARRRRAAASERARVAVSGMLADLPNDPEFAIEALRAGIRGMASQAAALAGTSRALGVLAGAAADICPAYRGQSRFAESEALFKGDAK